MTKKDFKNGINCELKAANSLRRVLKITDTGVNTTLIFDGMDMHTITWLNDRFANGIRVDENNSHIIYINTPLEKKVQLSKSKPAEKVFPNGFTSWQETHYEVVAAIHSEWNQIWQIGEDNPNDTLPQTRIATIQAQQGHAGLYELAEELTDKFEELNKGREWDGEFYDEVESFLQTEIKR